jgi:hypothetical protein
MATVLVGRQLQGKTLEGNTIVSGYGAFIVFAKDIIEIGPYPGDES